MMFFYKFPPKMFFFLSFLFFSTQMIASPQYIIKVSKEKIDEGDFHYLFVRFKDTIRCTPLVQSEVESYAKEKIRDYIRNNTKCPFEALALANGYGIPIHGEENFKPELIESIKRKMMNPNNTMLLEEAVNRGTQFGLDLQAHLFPAYWTDFLKNLKEKSYDELLLALEAFSKNNLQGAATEVFKDCSIEACQTAVTVQWLESVFNKVFGENGKYKGQIQAKQDFEWFLKALQVRDDLTHIGLQMCNQVYTRMKQENQSIQTAYAHFLPPQICEEENLTEGVADYVVKNKVQPEVAYKDLSIQLRREKYKRDFQISNEFAQSVAEYVTVHAKSLEDALFLSMKQPILVQNIDIRRYIANMLVLGNSTYDICVKQAERKALEKFVTEKKLGIDENQFNKIIELWVDSKSLTLQEVLKKTLSPIMCRVGKSEEMDLTLSVVNLMLDKVMVFEEAKRQASIIIRKSKFVTKKFPEELSEKLATFITDSTIEDYDTCLSKAFETHLKDGLFEGKNLKPEIINFLMQNQNYVAAVLKAKQKFLAEAMQLKGFTLQEANAFTGLVILQNTKRDAALKTILTNHPKFLKNKNKIDSAIKLILRDQNALTVTQAWEELCVKPWLETISKNYSFPEEIQHKVANVCAEGKEIPNALEIALKEKFNGKEKFSGYLEELVIELLKNATMEQAQEVVLVGYYKELLKIQKLNFLDIEEISKFIFKADIDFNKGLHAYIISKAPRLEEDDFNDFIEFCKKHKQKDLQELEKNFLLGKYSVKFLKKYPALEKNRAEEMARLVVEENYSIDDTEKLLTITLTKIDQYSMEIATVMAKILVFSPSVFTTITQVKDRYQIDLKSLELQKEYSNLEKDICEKIAKRLYENQNLTLEKSLEEILKEREIESENVSEALEMILKKDKSIEEIEAEFGLAPVLKFYPMLKKEDAKAVATLIRLNKKNLRNEKDVKWALLIHIKSTYEYEDDEELFLTYLHKYKLDLFDCVAVLKKLKDKIGALKFDPYFSQVTQNQIKDNELLKVIKLNVENLTETESNQFLWDICEEAYQAGNLDDIETGFAFYLLRHQAPLAQIPTFIEQNKDLQKNFFITITQYVLQGNGERVLVNAFEHVSNKLLSQQRQKKVKENFYSFIKRENNQENLCDLFWLKYFEESDVTSILCLLWWNHGWDGSRSIIPILEDVMIDYFSRTARGFLKRENDDQYIIPRVRAIVTKKMIKSQNGLKFEAANKEISQDIKKISSQYMKKQPFLNKDLVELFAYDSYFYPFVRHQEIEEGLCREWRLTYPDCFVKFFNVEENKNVLIKHLKNAYPYDKKDLEGEGVTLQAGDYIETLSQQMEYLESSEEVSQGLNVFQKWLEVKKGDLKKLYSLEENDLSQVTWSHFINKLEIELSLKRVLNNKATIYGKITPHQDALPIAYILKNSKELLTLEKAHRIHVINKKVDSLELPLIKSLKKEVATQIVDKKNSQNKALGGIVKKYYELQFKEISSNLMNNVFELVSNGMSFSAAFVWVEKQSKFQKEDNLINAVYKEITSKSAYVQIANTVKKYVKAMDEIMGEEISTFQAICDIYDYIQVNCAQMLLMNNHALAINTHLKELIFDNEMLEKMSEIPKKTWGEGFVIDCLRQLDDEISLDCNPGGRGKLTESAEDIIRIYPEILDDPFNLDGVSAAKLLRKAWNKIPNKVLNDQKKFTQNNNKIIIKRKDEITKRKNLFVDEHKKYELYWKKRDELEGLRKKRCLELMGLQTENAKNVREAQTLKLKNLTNATNLNELDKRELNRLNQIEILIKEKNVEELLELLTLGELFTEQEKIEFLNLGEKLRPWESNPNHPQHEECISTIIKTLDKREPIEFLLDCTGLKYNPFFVMSKIDTLIPDNVLLNEYREMRDNLISFVHLSDDFGNPLELKNALGRWFAWAGLDCNKYKDTLFLELEWAACNLYRKRMKYIYMNLLDPKKYKKEQVTQYLSLLDTEVLLVKCIDAATDGLDKLEALISGTEELTLHQRVVMSLTSRLKEILDQFSVDQKYGGGKEESVENRLFVEIACKDHFSLFVYTEAMRYNTYGVIKLKEFKSLVTDALDIFEKELLQIVYGKIKPGAKSGKAAGYDIYLMDLMEWMKSHPKYCNELDCGSFFKFPEEGKQIPTFESTKPILIDLLEDCQVIRRKKSNSQEINIFEN